MKKIFSSLDKISNPMFHKFIIISVFSVSVLLVHLLSSGKLAVLPQTFTDGLNLPEHINRIVLMSIGALIVVFVRLSLGIRMLGPVRPVLIALAFQVTGFTIGLIFMVAIMVVIALLRPTLRRAGTPYFARIAIALNIIAFIIIMTLKASAYMGFTQLLSIAMLPVVVLTFAAEGFARTLYTEGVKSAVWRTFTTIVVAALIYLLVKIPAITVFIQNYPESILIQIALIALISKKFKWQLFESLNPIPNPALEEKKPEIVKSKPTKTKRKISAKKISPKLDINKEENIMKVAVVRNRNKEGVLYNYGRKSPETYGKKSVQKVIDALRESNYDVKVFEGDISLFSSLKEFIQPDQNGQPNGLVFNMSYGIQGDCRYTHLPAMLEMVGVPYSGSNPLGHALSLDKFITKQILQKADIPTPNMVVLSHPTQPIPTDLTFPLIVKPRHESSSLGIKVVHNHYELQEAARLVIDTFQQDALVEEYIEGRELCVGLVGNGIDIEVFPYVEIDFKGRKFPVLTKDDKFHRSEDEPEKICPSHLGVETDERIKQVALAAIKSVQIRDYARVDMRISADGTPYIIEINSMASLGQGGSFVLAAKHAGYSFAQLIDKIIQTTAIRVGLKDATVPVSPFVFPIQQNELFLRMEESAREVA